MTKKTNKKGLPETRLQELQNQAYDAGMQDSDVWDILTEHGHLFIDTEVEDELTEGEINLLVVAYESGFLGKRMPFLKLTR